MDHWLHHMFLDLNVVLDSKTYRSETKQNRQAEKHKNRMTKKAMLRRRSRTEKNKNEKKCEKKGKKRKRMKTDVMLVVHMFLLDNNIMRWVTGFESISAPSSWAPFVLALCSPEAYFQSAQCGMPLVGG